MTAHPACSLLPPSTHTHKPAWPWGRPQPRSPCVQLQSSNYHFECVSDKVVKNILAKLEEEGHAIEDLPVSPGTALLCLL